MSTTRVILSGANTQWVLGEAKSNPAFDRVVKRLSVKLIESSRGVRDIFEFDKAHWSILLGAEAETLVATLFGEHSLELVFGRINWQVTDVESIAGWVLVSWVDRWIVMPEMLIAANLKATRRTMGSHITHGRIDAMRRHARKC